MKWIKFRIKTVTAAEDIIISTLYDLGLEGAQIEDKIPLSALEKEQMFIDILPEYQDDDGIAWLSFFVEQTDAGLLVSGAVTDAQALTAQINAELESLRAFTEIGAGTITVSETEDLDWINNWKQYFHQFYIDDILVVPSWEEIKAEDADKITLHIDPGTAFGTGMHETTQLCIRQLRKYVTDTTKLLDIGCGSGILSILALKFGAAEAVGTDLDPCALTAVAENKQANGIAPHQFNMMIGNLITDEETRQAAGYECYDVAVANILADVLIPLTPIAVRHLKKGGIYITSGIINQSSDAGANRPSGPDHPPLPVSHEPLSQEEKVLRAIRAAGMKILEITRQGEWISVTAQK